MGSELIAVSRPIGPLQGNAITRFDAETLQMQAHTQGHPDMKNFASFYGSTHIPAVYQDGSDTPSHFGMMSRMSDHASNSNYHISIFTSDFQTDDLPIKVIDTGVSMGTKEEGDGQLNYGSYTIGKSTYLMMFTRVYSGALSEAWKTAPMENTNPEEFVTMRIFRVDNMELTAHIPLQYPLQAEWMWGYEDATHGRVHCLGGARYAATEDDAGDDTRPLFLCFNEAGTYSKAFEYDTFELQYDFQGSSWEFNTEAMQNVHPFRTRWFGVGYSALPTSDSTFLASMAPTLESW